MPITWGTVWAIILSNEGFWIFFQDSLKSRHAQVSKSLLFRKLTLEIGLDQRTEADVWEFILLYSRAKCIFSCVNQSWIEDSVSWKKNEFPLSLWKWMKMSSWTSSNLPSKMSLKSIYGTTSFDRNCMVRTSLSRAIHYYSSLRISFFRVFMVFQVFRIVKFLSEWA